MSELIQFGQHPDADQLTAFVEDALPPHEREQTLAHLAACADCRSVVALSLSPLEESPNSQAEPVRKPWFMGWHLVWPAGAAFAALAFFVIHLHDATPIKSGGPVPAEIAASRPPATLPGTPPSLASQPTAEPKSLNQTIKAGSKPPNNSAIRQDQSMANLAIMNAPLPPPEVAPSAGVRNGPPPMNIAVAPTLSQGQAAISSTLPQPNTVIAGDALATTATAAPAPQSISKARVPAPSSQAAAGAAISIAQDSNASATNFVINGRNIAPLAASLPAAALLPSRLPALSTAINGHLVLAIDTQNTLFYSEDEGKHWTPVPTQWRGRAVRVNLAGSAGTAAQNATMRTTAASFGSIADPIASSTPTSGASVTGTITDASGAVVPNASITITNPATAISRTVISDTNGRYRAENLIPGNYQFEAAAPGFQRRQFGVNVAASVENQANITLTLGSVSETVTVEAVEAMPLATTQSDVISRAALKKAAPRARAPVFEITTDNGDHWASADGKTWTKK